jgi:carboxymethylenebutenolidase
MCDNDSLEDMIEYRLRSAGLSRRQFGALSLGAGVLSLLPPVAGAAAEVKESEVDIKTPDGSADAYFAHPSTGTYPGVLLWPDIYGLRPAFRQMGKKLAEWSSTLSTGRSGRPPLPSTPISRILPHAQRSWR